MSPFLCPAWVLQPLLNAVAVTKIVAASCAVTGAPEGGVGDDTLGALQLCRHQRAMETLSKRTHPKPAATTLWHRCASLS